MLPDFRNECSSGNTAGRFYIPGSQPARCPDVKRAENLAAKIHNYKCECKFLLDINEDMKIIVNVIQVLG